jgi:two-component system, NarL family, sensor histidine kinase DevS
VDLLCDLAVREPVGDQPQDVPLLGAQARKELVFFGAAAEPLEDAGRYRRIEKRPAAGDGAHRLDDVRTLDLLQDVPRRARQDRLEERFIVRERREHEALDLGMRRADLPADLHAVTVGESDVEHRDIGTRRRNACERFGRGSSLSHDFEVPFSLEELLDPATDDLVVIEEEHPHIAHASPQYQNVPLPFSRIDPHVQQLLDAITSVGTDLSLPIVLERIVESACSLVSANYGALGVIGDDKHLSEFITVGIEPERYAAIGHLPEGHGILGLLIVDPRPLRLRDLGVHDQSVGFPPNHPDMRSFLGVPVRVRDAVFGNLYLCDKQGADEFTEEDESLAIALATAAGVAIENARLMQRTEEVAVLEDRERIARDLHDKVIQRLFATGMTLQTMLPVTGRDDLSTRINDAVDELDVTIREIRSTIFALQSPAQRGLRVSIFALIDGAREVLGFSPELHMDGPIDTLVSERTAEHLLAVLQEALSNIAQHAGASHVNVTVEVGTDVVVRVTDNGKGLPKPRENGRGLHNIEHRAATMGGDLSVSDRETGGTVVEWRVPVTA